MDELGFNKQIEALVNQLTERFNLAFSIALDDEKDFEQSETIFQELIAVLDYYSCFDIISEQNLNYSKIAFYREKYDKALFYATVAVDKADSSDKAKIASDNLHSMAFKIFDIILMSQNNTIRGIGFEDVQEFLLPEDYCIALKNAYNSIRNVKNDNQSFSVEILKRLTLEVLRQGIRQEKNGNNDAALLLYETVIPFLNPKRAEIVRNEIIKLKEIKNNE